MSLVLCNLVESIWIGIDGEMSIRVSRLIFFFSALFPLRGIFFLLIFVPVTRMSLFCLFVVVVGLSTCPLHCCGGVTNVINL